MSYEYRIGKLYQATGLVTSASGSTVITGASSAFNTDFAYGDYLTVAGQTRIVQTITSASRLVVDTAYTTSASGQSANRVRLLDLETDLNVPAPKGLLTPYTQPVTLGNGLVRGAGWRTAEWKWGFVGRAVRQALRAYCPGASANVYIKTRTNENSDAFAIYNANMVWPQTEDPQAGRRLDFSIKFQGLIPWP